MYKCFIIVHQQINKFNIKITKILPEQSEFYKIKNIFH